MQQKSDLDFSSGLTILPGLPFKSGRKPNRSKRFLFFLIILEVSIVAICFCQDKPEQIAVFYGPVCLIFSCILLN